MTQDWGLSVAHLTLDRNLCLHVHLTKPSSQDGDDRAWKDKHWCEVHHGDGLISIDTDLVKPLKVLDIGPSTENRIMAFRHTKKAKSLQARIS
jgi:hypothetical protein